MPRRFTSALLGGFFMMVGSAVVGPGNAETISVCGPRDAVVRLLRTEHGEQRAADALTASGRHLMLFATPDGARWTIAVTDPHGTTCIVAVGVDWQDRSSVPADTSSEKKVH